MVGAEDEEACLPTYAAVGLEVDRESLSAARVGTFADVDRLLCGAETLFQAGDVPLTSRKSPSLRAALCSHNDDPALERLIE